MAQWAAETQKPLLCICRGTQVLNVALGGSLVQDIETMQPKALRHMYDQEVTPREQVTHSITVNTDSLLGELIQLECGASELVASSGDQAHRG